MNTLPDSALDADIAKAVRAFVGRVAAQYPVSGAILFGSRARGDHRQYSDVDIAILLKGCRSEFVEITL